MLNMSLDRQSRPGASRNADQDRTARPARPSWRAAGTWLLLSAIGIGLVGGRACGDDDYVSPDYFSGPGVMFRGALSAGQGVPQIQSIMPVELFPYYFAEESLFFTDFRFFPTVNLTVGGNAGLGYRYYNETLDRVFGASAWYDADNTRSVLFQQAGLSFETYSQNLDFRTNIYLPVGTTTRQTAQSVVANSVQFSGNNLVFGQYRAWYASMAGFDMEVGTLVPGEIASDMGLRVYGGGYYYQDNSGNNIVGASTRMQANLVAGLDAQVQVTYDNYFQTRAFAGISWTFGALHRSEMKQATAYGRMGEHVTRNYTVVAEGHSEVDSVTAINPATGKPYTFAHVSTAPDPPGPLGSATNPFRTIAAAQATGSDIVYVHANSVFNGGPSIVLLPNQRVIGDGNGVQNFIQIPQLGSVLLPHTAGNLPTINGSTGDAVVLASNSVFTGFSITNAQGNGIVGNGVQNVTLNNIFVNHSGLDGIKLQNTPGTVSITNAYVSNAGGAGIDVLNNTGLLQFQGNSTVINSTGAGINVNGGTGQTQFAGLTTVSGTAGDSVAISNLAAGASAVSFNNLSIDHRQGMGLDINNSAGTVNVTGTLTVTNENTVAPSALNIVNSAGVNNFSGVNVVAATGNPAVNLQTDTGTTNFNILNIGSQGGTALAANNAGNLNINAAVNGSVNVNQGGTINAVNGTAIQIANTNLNVNFQSVSSSNAVTGISLVNTPGLFAVFGNGTTAASAGTIQNDTTGVFLQNTGQVGFQWLALNANGAGIRAIGVSNLLVSNSTIFNSNGFGIDAQNTATMTVASTTFSGNGGANIHGQFNQLGTYNYTFTNNTMTSAGGDNIVLAVVSGGEGSSLNLFDQGDKLTNNTPGTAGINLGWNGNLAATIDHTLFTVSGGGNTGLLVNNASTSALSTITMTNSGFLSRGGTDTAVHVVTVGPSQLNFSNNTVEWDAANGIGFRMSQGASSTANIASNTFTDTVGGATGVLFDSLTGPGNVTMNNNLMNMFSSGTDQGIIFSGITNTIQLSGTNDNRISNAATPFFSPFGTTTGGIFVNGTERH